MFEIIWQNELAVGRVAVSFLLRDCWGRFPERMHMDLKGRHQSRGLTPHSFENLPPKKYVRPNQPCSDNELERFSFYGNFFSSGL